MNHTPETFAAGGRSPRSSRRDPGAGLHTEPVNLANLDVFAVLDADALAEMFTQMTNQVILPQLVSAAGPVAA